MTYRDPAVGFFYLAAFVHAAFEGSQTDLPVCEIDVAPADLDELTHPAASLERNPDKEPVAAVMVGPTELDKFLYFVAGEVLRELGAIERHERDRGRVSRGGVAHAR